MVEEAKRPATAGSLLRVARENHGLHIAALAAAMKVAPRKLDALENDRWNELPDATFVRALALTVCRTLKMDAKPVLDLLPPAQTMALQSIGEHLNTPYHDTDGRSGASAAGLVIRPMVWAAAALMVAAVAVYFVPQNWFTSTAPAAATVLAPALPAALPELAAPALPGSAAASLADSAAPLPVANAAAVTPSVGETVFSAPPANSQQATPATGALQLRTTEASWVDVRDSRGQALLSRIVQPGEMVSLDGAPPLRLTIGNAAATQLTFRGQAVSLTPSTRDNVARVELP